MQEQLINAKRDVAVSAVFKRKAESVDELRQELDDCKMENIKLQD